MDAFGGVDVVKVLSRVHRLSRAMARASAPSNDRKACAANSAIRAIPFTRKESHRRT
jgi:hypothetical protein